MDTSSKPLFIARRSPLVEGGKARLMSARKVTPRPAKPFNRDNLTDDEASGYVTEPFLGAQGEPECIGPAIVESYAEVNRLIFTQQHVLDVALAQQTRPQLPPDARAKDLQRRAKGAHVDLSHELHIIDRHIVKARLAGRDVPQHVLTRLEGLEALLDGVELAAA